MGEITENGNSANNVLIVYYSRTGTAKTVAEGLKTQLGCSADCVEYAGRANKPSFMRAGFEAVTRRVCKIKGDDSGCANFGRVIVITPVWASRLSTPIRSYLKNHGPQISSYSLIGVLDSNGDIERDATEAAGKKPEKYSILLSVQVKGGEIDYESLATLAE